MNGRRYFALFAGALALACLATLGVYRLVGRREPAAKTTRAVAVVAQPVGAGAAVPREAVALVEWPTATVPAGAFAHVDSVAGRVALVPLGSGAPVLAAHLAPRGAAPGLEATIAPGHRAMAVRVGEALGSSGLLHADSHVDVLVTVRDDEAGARPRARLLMSDVRVLAVGAARTPASPEEPPRAPTPAEAAIVTLEVTPAQAEQIAVVESQGTIQLVLRGFGSQDRAVTAGTTARDVLGLPERAAAALAAAPGASLAAPPRVALPTVAVTPQRGGASTSAGRPAGRAADSVTVRVFRGDKLTIERFEATTPVARPREASVVSRAP